MKNQPNYNPGSTYLFPKFWLKNIFVWKEFSGQKTLDKVQVPVLVELYPACLSLRVNKAFVGLENCDNVQTERSILEYANWPRLQVKRTGQSS